MITYLRRVVAHPTKDTAKGQRKKMKNKHFKINNLNLILLYEYLKLNSSREWAYKHIEGNKSHIRNDLTPRLLHIVSMYSHYNNISWADSHNILANIGNYDYKHNEAQIELYLSRLFRNQTLNELKQGIKNNVKEQIANYYKGIK